MGEDHQRRRHHSGPLGITNPISHRLQKNRLCCDAQPEFRHEQPRTGSFVPTTFFAEFLAGAQGLASESHHDARGYAKHRLTHAEVVPPIPSRGR